jgi:transcriptional repressor NrdR
VSKRRIEELVNNVEAEIRDAKDRVVESTVIGEMVMDRLRSLDRVAYIRFASVYKEFEDVSNFEKVLRTLD